MHAGRERGLLLLGNVNLGKQTELHKVQSPNLEGCMSGVECDAGAGEGLSMSNPLYSHLTIQRINIFRPPGAVEIDASTIRSPRSLLMISIVDPGICA